MSDMPNSDPRPGLLPIPRSTAMVWVNLAITVIIAAIGFGVGFGQGMKAQEVKDYIRYIGDRRLTQLGLTPVFGIEKNPLPWMDAMLNGAEHANFFENRATEYSKASTQGSWEEAFEEEAFKGAA